MTPSALLFSQQSFAPRAQVIHTCIILFGRLSYGIWLKLAGPTGRWGSQPPLCAPLDVMSLGDQQLAERKFLTSYMGRFTDSSRAMGRATGRKIQQQLSRSISTSEKQRSANSSRSIQRLANQRRRGHTRQGSCLSRSEDRRDPAPVRANIIQATMAQGRRRAIQFCVSERGQSLAVQIHHLPASLQRSKSLCT